MQRIGFVAVSLFIFFSLIPAIAQPSANIAGQWKLTAQMTSNGGVFPICSFLQTGNNLAGSCSAPLRTGEITGTIRGTTINWYWHWSDYNDSNSGTANFAGTLGPRNAISGTMLWSNVSYVFTGIKQ